MSHVPKRFLGAFKRGHYTSAQDFVDEELSQELLARVLRSDYRDKEAVEALDFITKFNNEFHKAALDKTAPLNNEQVVAGELDSKGKPLTYRKQMWSRANARNRDIMSVRLTQKSILIDADDELVAQMSCGKLEIEKGIGNPEDAVIDLIDLKSQAKKI